MNSFKQEKTLVYLSVNELYPHPDNPRKDVGDVSELADSIKANGIYQNLTVVSGGKGVPDGADGYTVIIGHRRIAASKLAGIGKVPCAVVEMDEKTQVSTMLLENMQRSDLTVYEQAQGFQMMLDFGETQTSISEKTGFSPATVSRRLKLLELDRDKFEQSSERGCTLNDYIKLNDIKDVSVRNKLLDKLGTSNFDFEYKNALDKQKKDEISKLIISKLPISAVVVNSYADLPINRKYITRFFLTQKPNEESFEYVQELEDLYIHDEGYCITVYQKTEDAPAPKRDIKAEKRAEEIKRRMNELDNMAEMIFELRKEFIEKLNVKKFSIETVIEFCVKCGDKQGYKSYELEELCNMMDIEYDDGCDEDNYDDIKLQECLKKDAVKTLVYQQWLMVDDGAYDKCHQWNNNEFYRNESLEKRYKMLKILGYEMSTAEQAYLDGSHELYQKVE